MADLLHGTPCIQIDRADWFEERLRPLEQRIEDLRRAGRLTESTLRAYFGDKRFEEVAESNAIEGSPLTVRETELAIRKGVTISGHDPSWSRDAIHLDEGIRFLHKLARSQRPIHLTELRELHGVILAGAAGAGQFRRVNVQISGAPHVPPFFQDVPSRMREWADWSATNEHAPPVIRAIVLSVWLTHIHPFHDGNGRTSRAVMNLELIRGGLPSVIIRRKDRQRYYEALAESDSGGDMQAVSDLILLRAEHALSHLERTARAQQGYDKERAAILRVAERHTRIWNSAAKLLVALTLDNLQEGLGDLGEVSLKWYTEELDVSDYQALCGGKPEGNSWLARFRVDVPGVACLDYLMWVGFRSSSLTAWRKIGAGPAIKWSVPDPSGHQKWMQAGQEAPGFEELTLELPNADRWIARSTPGDVLRVRPSELAQKIGKAILGAMSATPANPS